MNKLRQVINTDVSKKVRNEAKKAYRKLITKPIAQEEQNSQITELLRMINDNNQDVKIKAVQALGNLPYRYQRVEEQLELCYQTEKSADVKQEIVNALENLETKKRRLEFREKLGALYKISKWFKKLLSIKDKYAEPVYTIEIADHFIIKKCLWEHVIYYFQLKENKKITDVDVERFRPLINSSQKQTSEQKFGALDVSLDPKIRVYPGFGTSLILASKDSDILALNFPRVVEIAEYYYAATDLMDDIMFDKFASFTQQRDQTLDIDLIEENIYSIRRLSNMLEMFLFEVKDSILNFDKDAKQIWRALEKEWYYLPMIDSLTEKSKMLNEKYTEYLGELNEKRAGLFNKLALIFTVILGISGIFEAWSFIKDMEIDIAIERFFTTHIPLSIFLLITVGFLLLIIVAFLIRKLREFGRIF